ncbi:class I SAM-dependent methyltransferase [Pedobacter punctiformis]|uniref:Class I SAM-dependent methyltransferase n=1 Tax=Pedobacter punctiformis TaxID=3004097 RepID=A0ABT4L5K8_9SPHI|nr:class I SAM-dependent methyltransferase [Pedobacter sp. HCMS5-2]MCZ4243207.1 class I SAM-dependent methyltransferase [Pedobacter sp. HCMS5-2]
MENQYSENDLREVAAQLSCPQGEKGLKTAAMMNISNKGMTESAISAMTLQDGNQILEIGPGNANHLEYLLQQAENLAYTGADISPLMIEEASKINASFIQNNQAKFTLTNPDTLPFAAAVFNKVFTVNTIYFWKNPEQFLDEIFRILTPGGTFVLCFADKSFMENLPFTPFGFQLYNVDSATELLKKSAFDIEKTAELTEEIYNNIGQPVSRKYYVIRALKAG